MRKVLMGLAIATAAAAAIPAASSASTSPPEAVAPINGVVSHAGRWLTDDHGRVVIMHGINVSMKGSAAQAKAYRFGTDDAAFLAQLGFNVVRLTVERYDVEPTPGHFDHDYLALMRSIVTTLAAKHIQTIVDFHQDEFGPVFYDNGYPDWMTQTGGLPNLYQLGFPFQYLGNPAVNHAFDTLWSNGLDTRGKHLWDDDAEILATTAAVMRDAPGVLAYEILNEPWPGTVYPTCAAFVVGCPLFDKGPVSGYYAAMTKAIQSKDPHHLVLYEPMVLFNYGIPTSITPPAGKQIGFAFHDYPLCSAADDAGLPITLDTDCAAESELTLANATSYSQKTKTALIETEFGAFTDEASINAAVALYDKALVPWIYWSYAELVGTDSLGAFGRPSAGHATASVVRALSQPYPQLISGTPTDYGYDPQTHRFHLTYTTKKVAGGGFASGSATTVAVPVTPYPRGYRVQVTGGRVISAPGAALLRVAASATTVSVVVTPAA